MTGDQVRILDGAVAGAPLPVGIDTETTGLSPGAGHGVVQVGIAWRGLDESIQTWSRLCDPGIDAMDPRAIAPALRVNRITPARIRDAQPARLVAQELRRQLSRIGESTGRPLQLRAYNRAFDEPFLGMSPWSLPSEMWGPCVMRAAAAHWGQGQRMGLARAMRAWRIPWPGHAHDAGVDAHAALLVLEQMEPPAPSSRARW